MMSGRKVTTLAVANGAVAGKLVEVGGMLFSSSVTGHDPRTGRLAGDPAVQAEAAFGNLARLLGDAGASADGLGLVTACIAEGLDADVIEAPWRAAFPDEANRPARRVNRYALPDGEQVQLLVTGVGDAARARIGLPGFDDDAPAAVGVRLGDVVFSSPIDGRDPATGRRSEDPAAQMHQAFRNMEAFLARAGAKKDDLIHVYIFIRGRADQKTMLDVWLEEFPVDGDRPARKAIFDDALVRDGKAIELMCVAVPGRGRRVDLEVPGISKSHPNPMGCRIGNLVCSSGMGGNDPSGRETGNDAATRAELALANMGTLLEVAGGGLGDVGLVSITVNDYADERAIVEQWRRVFPDPADEPARHVMAYGGRGSYPVQLHVVAALGGG